MRSLSVPTGAARRPLDGVLTGGESSFRNAKLGRAALVAYKAIADVAGKGSIFVLTLIAARRLTPHAFGIFGVATTVGWMLSVAADFGVQMHLARRVAQAPELAGQILQRWWRVRAIAIAAGLCALAVGLAAFGVDRAQSIPLLLFAAFYLLSGAVELVFYFYRGLSRSDLESTLTIWQRAATLACGAAALIWRPSVSGLAVAMLLPTAATLAWSLRAARRLAPSTDAGRAADGAPGEFLRDVFPIGAGIVLSAIYFRVDVVLVQAWAGTEAAGSYNAVFRLVDALRLFPAAMLAVMLPALCRADDLTPLARVSALLIAFALVVSAVVWIGADRIVALAFGARYLNAAPSLRILALAFPLLSLNFALTHQLVGWNRQRAYAGVCAAALALNLALNAWLIPLWSIEGAAWATLGTEVCVTSGCLLALRGGA
jgi:O-antigen/teichoic acid export membrane protein